MCMCGIWKVVLYKQLSQMLTDDAQNNTNFELQVLICTCKKINKLNYARKVHAAQYNIVAHDVTYCLYVDWIQEMNLFVVFFFFKF